MVRTRYGPGDHHAERDCLPRAIATALAIASALLLSACTAGFRAPDLGALYNEAAAAEESARRPVLVIPGILGSRLTERDSGRTVWGAFTGDYADPTRPEDARLIALPMQQGPRLASLTDRVRSDGSLDTVDINFFFIPVSLNAYVEILGTLGVGGYRDRQLGQAGAIAYGPGHYTCDQFDYDWRRDISEHAADLHQLVKDMAEYAATVRGQDEPVKVDLVAHSMGGLVARYYLRYGPQPLPDDGSLPELTWEGARYVNRLIMVGTPNAGSALSLLQLLQGHKVAPFLPEYDQAILGSMPAIYQLLPRARHAPVLNRDTGEPVDLLDPEVWIAHNWGLADPRLDRHLARLLPDATTPDERRLIALDHLRKALARADQFHRALDRPATPPEDLSIILIAGDAETTPARFTVNPRTGALARIGTGPGDGTVLRSSALMDERASGDWSPRLRSPIGFDQVIFLTDDHLGLTKSPTFANNILYLLLEEPQP